MAPGANSNNNNQNRQTGTKPKTKSSKKNSVPREVVAPTRRDLQQQLNVLVDWATVSGVAEAATSNQQQAGSAVGASGSQQNILLKPRNNRTPGEGTCYEIDNLALQDNSRYIPVRPIVRRNLLSESAGTESGEQHNTTVGVVIPTTPNSALQTFRLNDASGASSIGINNLINNNTGSQKHILNPFQQQQLQQQQQQQQLRASPLSSRVPDGASQNQLNLNKNSNQQQQQLQQQQQQFYGVGAIGGGAASKANFEDKLNQIQEYIKLTTNLISSVQNDNSLSQRKQSQEGGKQINISTEMGDQSCYFMPINSTSLESVPNSDSELNGPRPQSVQSICTNNSTTPVQTPSYDELRYRMEGQSRNMQALKEQQAHLLRLQQAARQQLQEMEAIRHQTAANVVPLENFESVEQVQEGISSVMERMHVLASFIQNQQALSKLLGGENDDVVNEQDILQQKFQELRHKKAQMHNLVSELQNLNVEASRHFETTAPSTGVERNVPIELTNAPAPAADMKKATKTFNQNNVEHAMLNGTRGGSITPKVENVLHDNVDGINEDEDEEEESEAIAGTADMLNEKINEINAMKSQLRRLKEMMDTVKLIEMKTGDSTNEDEDVPDENNDNADTDENSRSPSVASQISDQAGAAGGPTDKRREQLNQRVEALHAMTRDLREQAKSIAAERDALKISRSEIEKRRNNVAELQHQAEAQTSEKLTNHVASLVSSLPVGAKEREQIALKAELEQKRRELERIEKMTHSIKKNTELSRRNTEVAPPKVSSVSSTGSLQSPSHPPVIPPPPATSAANITSASNATNHSKNSADSGVTDIFANAQLESGSYQSSSTRSLNMVPPMPDICNRADRYHRKSEEVSASAARTSPWPAHLFGGSAGVGPSSSNTGPQSPHPFHPFVGSDIQVSSAYPAYNVYPNYSNLLPPHTPNSAPPLPDPLMFQHFMQTQQMLMNSITQCNQLLWIQQREINNLNNAVLLLQERILNNGNNNILLNDIHVPGAGAHIRAESTPPNNSLNSAGTLSGSVYSRARSEQPSMNHQQTPSSPYQTIPSNTVQHTPYGSLSGGSTGQFHPFTPTSSHQSSAQFSINQQIQRNNTNISNANAAGSVNSNSSQRSYRNLRHVNINTANNAIYEQQQLQQQPLYSHQVSLQQHSNNFMNLNNPLQQTGAADDDTNLQHQPFNNVSVVAGGGSNLGPSHMINNLANGPTTTMQTGGPLQVSAPPPAQQQVCLNNLNNSSNNSNASQQTQALNNQVLPGVRANNYWDNFRSYSRQNLLSSNSCKSNEDSCTLSSGSCTNNINNQIQRNNSNTNNYNNSATCGSTGQNASNKYSSNFNRNNSLSNINQQTVSDVGSNPQQPNMSHQQPQQHYSSLPSSQQQQQQAQQPPQESATSFQQIPQTMFHQQQHHQQQQQQSQQQQQHHNPLNQSNSLDLGELQFHTNPINLGLANKSSHPKASGHKKYPLSLRSCRDGSNSSGEVSSNFYAVGAHADMISDLNLATASNYQHDSKSSSKLFEALKENVYQEVKNLITANESRPHFLIQLFRELQLISSDPLRQRTLQSIQELYNRYIETTLQQEQQEGHVNNIGSNNLLSSVAVPASATGNAQGTESAPGGQPPAAAENLEVVEMEVSQNFTNARNQQQQQQQQQQVSAAVYHFAPAAESNPNVANVTASGSNANDVPLGNELEANELGIPSSEIISIIMSDIVSVINSVDYINDSVLCKIAGVICNHATGASNGLFQSTQGGQQKTPERLLANPMLGPSMAAFLAQNDADFISREDFLRHLESWNRTDKDEFISNLENLLNNILLRSSAAEGDPGLVSSSNMNMNGDEEGQMRAQMQHQQQHLHDSLSSHGNGINSSADISTDNNETFASYPGNEVPYSPRGFPGVASVGGACGGRRLYGVSESDNMSNGVSSSNGYASTTYDLAEADQICDLDKSIAAGAVGGIASAPNSNAEALLHSIEDRRRMRQWMLDDDLPDMPKEQQQHHHQQQQQQQQQQQAAQNPDSRFGEVWQLEDE